MNREGGLVSIRATVCPLCWFYVNTIIVIVKFATIADCDSNLLIDCNPVLSTEPTGPHCEILTMLSYIELSFQAPSYDHNLFTRVHTNSKHSGTVWEKYWNKNTRRWSKIACPKFGAINQQTCLKNCRLKSKLP